MTECYFANYTIGKDAYENIKAICTPIGKNVLITGGETALEKAYDKLSANMSGFNIVDKVVYGKECYREILYRMK